MRYLLLSDVHANYVALEAVLRHARRQQWDKVIFLGDVVGYYPEADEATTKIRELAPEVCIQGNHDALLGEFAAGQENVTPYGSAIVGDVVRRHLAELSEENRSFVTSLERHVVRDSWEATHGALHEPWAYLTSLAKVQRTMPLMQTDLCFVGHTHIPMAYACTDSPKGELWRTVPFRSEHAVYRIPPRARVVFNPGSVGQPRDGLPMASYGIFDAGKRSIEVFRVRFDLARVRQLIRDRNYPEVLASRLEAGR